MPSRVSDARRSSRCGIRSVGRSVKYKLIKFFYMSKVIIKNHTSNNEAFQEPPQAATAARPECQSFRSRGGKRCRVTALLDIPTPRPAGQRPRGSGSGGGSAVRRGECGRTLQVRDCTREKKKLVEMEGIESFATPVRACRLGRSGAAWPARVPEDARASRPPVAPELPLPCAPCAQYPVLFSDGDTVRKEPLPCHCSRSQLLRGCATGVLVI